MDDVKKGAFEFESFKINNVSFSDNRGNSLSVEFKTKGEYNEELNKFELSLTFVGKNENDFKIIEVELIALFKFSEKTLFSEIPSYFYRNSIAIVFPYIRSFISVLTAQANTKMMILPVMNLSSLEIPLRENTTIVNK